jgi:hypothetical protein
MRRLVKPKPEPKKKLPGKRRYHPVDASPMCVDECENPDWLVGAN